AAGPAGSPGGGAANARSAEPNPQPPDGKWLKDEQGRLYFVEKLRKVEGQYRRIDAHTVRTLWAVPIDLLREHDPYFYSKMYKVDAGSPGPSRPSAKKPSAAEQARIAATYRAEAPESRRLRFVDFGKGLPASGQWREGFALADMNGDGHLDVVHAPPRKG